MNQSQIHKNKIVSLNYTLLGSDGEIFFSNVGLMPLVYLHGYGNVIPGLEKEMEGMCVGDKKKIVIEPDDGYGQVNNQLIFTKSLEWMKKENPNCDVGDNILLLVDGFIHEMRIVEIRGNQVILDGNQPLAGKTLIYDVEVVKINAATEEEILCGYPIEDAVTMCDKSSNCCC